MTSAFLLAQESGYRGITQCVGCCIFRPILSFSVKSVKIRFYSRLSRGVLSSPVPSRFFQFYPGFSRTTGPETSGLVTVPPIREVIASLVLSCLISNELKNANHYLALQTLAAKKLKKQLILADKINFFLYLFIFGCIKCVLNPI